MPQSQASLQPYLGMYKACTSKYSCSKCTNKSLCGRLEIGFQKSVTLEVILLMRQTAVSVASTQKHFGTFFCEQERSSHFHYFLSAPITLVVCPIIPLSTKCQWNFLSKDSFQIITSKNFKVLIKLCFDHLLQ